MNGRRRWLARGGAIVSVLLATAPAPATSWGPRDDLGVAAVEVRTGRVVWEAWRPEEVPADAPQSVKDAAGVLLAAAEGRRGPSPPAAWLPDASVEGLAVEKDRLAEWLGGPGPWGSMGTDLIYHRSGTGVIAFDRQTKKERWRLPTTRGPYPSRVLEPGDGLALVQIGSDVPATIRSALAGGGKGLLRMAGLEPHTAGQRAAAAVLLHHYGDGHLRPEVQKLAEQLRDEKADPAAKALDRLLTTWPVKRDRQRLLDGCVAALLKADDGNPLRGFAWPGAERVVAWCLLQELVYGSPRDGYSRQGYNYAYDGGEERHVSLPDAVKAKLAAHCRQVVTSGPDREKPFAGSVLVSTAVGWGRLSDAERKGLFLSPEPSVWRWAALALSKNGRRGQLIEWARERRADDHLDVIWLLKRDRPKDWGDAELAFWLDAARHAPGSVAYVLSMEHGSVPVAFREPIRAYLGREAATPTVTDGGTQPEYNLFAALGLLDRWKDAADTPLLQAYLKHPAASKGVRSDGAARAAVRTYNIRAHARSLLERRGVEVPPGIVYEEVGPVKD